MREARNFYAVQEVLSKERVFLWVYESQCVSSLANGKVLGQWQLGDGTGTCAGSVAWLSDARHVVRVVGTVASGMQASGSLPPWFRCVVGAPKKNKSRRGAHLKKGSEHCISGTRWSQALDAATSAQRS